jgi:predicted TPR repeat methyltransferase
MPSRDRPERWVERARSLASPAEACALYREWASHYDRDVYGRLKVTGTARIAGLLGRHLADRAARIIDLGCGTGAAGVELKRLGFKHIDGLDISPDMLAVARSKTVYRHVVTADLLAPLALADGAYEAAISAGTFTTGHVSAAALPEVLRIVQPQGLIACVVAQGFWETGGFAATLAELTGAGRLSVLHDSLEPVRHDGPPEGRFLVLVRS